MPSENAKDGGAERRRGREILARCKSAKVELVRFLYCGNDSVIRGKACHTRFLNSYLRSGIGLTVAMQSFNMLDQLAPEGSFGPVGEIRLVPDLETFALLPYTAKSARLLCDMHTLEGKPWDACPRRFLKRTIEQARHAGLALQATFENEFTLARRDGEQFVPIDRSPCFSTIGMDGATPVMIDVIEALIAQGVYPEQYYAELGPGQQELPVRFADALRAADNQLTVRDTARGVAMKHGLLASFAPKPFPDQAGKAAISTGASGGSRTARTTSTIPAAATGSRRRATRSSAASSRICPRSSRSRRRASTPTAACSRASGRARTPPGGPTTARPPSACRPRAAASRWSRPISS